MAPSRRWRSPVAAAIALAAAGVALASAAPVAGGAGHGHASPHKHRGLKAKIVRTRYGVPHITASNIAGLTFGYGYAFAQDDLCTIADSYVTVAGQRSKYFGPDGQWTFSGNGTVNSNLDSDFFYKRINKSGVIQRLMHAAPPKGPLPGVKRGVRGYVRGYNAYLRRTGVDNLPDPRCRGANWVRPIRAIDVYRRFYQLGSLASAGAAIDGIGSAAPLLDPAASASASQREHAALERVAAGKQPLGPFPLTSGSNAIGLGSRATQDGRGMVLGNPHFPWFGSERLYQAQLHIPGKLNVSGASLYGVPLVLIGQTRGLAWSHTVATAWRFTPYELTLAPGDPHSYMLDGKAVPMHGIRVTVQARTPSGGLEPVTRTLYSTRYGPLFTEIEGIPLPWTATTAWALGDANSQNFRYLNHFFLTDQAQSVRSYNHIERSYQGIPWVNSIAADRHGNAYYSMDGAIPYVSDAKARSCAAAGAGAGVFAATGLPFLDGSRSECAWSNSPKSAAPGLLPPSQIPRLVRSDYVENSNDSHWLSNPHRPLAGFPRIVGDQGSPRSLRTRLGLTMIEQRLHGTDGMPGRGFTLRDLSKVALNDRVYSAELWRDPLVRFCRTHPVLLGSSGPVDVRPACPILARWNLRYDLDAPGAVLFRRFSERLFANTTRLPTGTASGQWEGSAAFFTRPFDPSNPMNTPSGLNTADPLVGTALADAVQDLRSAGIPLDASLRRYQYVTRDGSRIPIHGGPGDPYGVFNAISSSWQPPKGFPDVTHGSSFIAAMGFSGGRCPVRQLTFVTYGQSENPDSPHDADYTRAFSRKRWEPEPFCGYQVRRQATSVQRISSR
jgi:acyl-homoserine-lactone acylase